MAVEQLREVQRDVADRALACGRDPAEITVVAVGKSGNVEDLLALYSAGHRDFGENRAEALAKRSGELPSDVRWHAIGRLQGNKVRRVRPATALLHSLDRIELVQYWLKGPGPVPPALVQVNVSGEPQKAGVAPAEAGALVAAAEAMGLPVTGLMTIAPLAEDPEASRPHFAALRALRDDLAVTHPNLHHLSMGMTQDLLVAVEEGATLLRVGRAIFGPASTAEG